MAERGWVRNVACALGAVLFAPMLCAQGTSNSNPTLDSLENALAQARAQADRAAEAAALQSIGSAHYKLAEYQNALDFFQKSRLIRQDLGDRSGEAKALQSIAFCWYALGEPQKALDAAQLQLATSQSIKDRAGEALAGENVGRFYYALDEPQKAIDAYQKALSVHRALGDRLGQARTLSILGEMYRDLGTDDALDFFRQSVAAARAAGDRAIESDDVMGMGDVYYWMGESQKSIDAYQQSAAVKRELGDRSGEALALIGIANVYSDLGARQKRHATDMRKAVELYEQSLQIGRTSQSPVVQVFALMGGGVAASALGDKQKALGMIQQAQFLFSLVRLKPGEGWAMYEQARIERDRGNLTEALNLATKARDIIESLRSRVVSQELRGTFFAAVQDCYSLEMEVLMRLDADDASHKSQAEALAASERARARVLLETLRESGAEIQQGVDPELLAKERHVQALLNAKETLRIQMIGTRHTPAQAAEVEKAVHDLDAQYQEVHTRIREESPRYAALNFPQPLRLEEIQSQVLDPETLLLEFALDEERSFLWLVSTSSIESVTLPGRAEVERIAREFSDALKNPDAPPVTESGRALSRMLFSAVTSRLGEKRLLIVADGVLQYIPFAALPDPASPRQPLVVTHEIVSIPSASTLAVLRREVSGRKPAPKALAILADPVFSSEDARVPSSNERSLDLHLARLPGTRREAAAIAALVPQNQKKVALDFDASRATLTAPDMEQYRMIHLATHGLLNAERPELSGIALSMVDRRGRKQDGFVRLNEIYNLKLSADLVVLSACQTALGKDIRGEGLVSLTRGFMYAGVPRVLASLWKVDDRATAELMKRFYAALLRPNPLRPAAALREAELGLSKTREFAAPHYWAAFIIEGEWN